MTHRRIIAFICVAVLLMTQYSFLASAAPKTEISLAESFVEELRVTKPYDGKEISEVTFPDVNPEGVRSNHEVLLAAEAEYEQTGVGEDYAVTLRKFHLIGKDANKYLLTYPDSEFTYETKGDITQRPLHLIPRDDAAHLTTDTYPISVDFTVDEEDIVDGDAVLVLEGTDLRIVQDGSDYVYEISADSGVDNANYALAVQENAKPDVQRPEAPELEENYLYGDTASVLEWHSFGIIADGDLHLEVKATESQDLPMTITFYGGQAETSITSEEGEAFTDDSGNTRYRHTVVFDLKVAEGKTSEFRNVTCRLDNGNPVDELLTFRMQGNQTSDVLILDAEEPAFGTKPTITYNNKKKTVDVNGTLTDIGSGIAKMEYKWDEDQDYKEIPLSVSDDDINEEVPLNLSVRYNSKELPKKGDSKYKLFLRVTDRTGNVFEPDADTYSEDDEGGLDSMPPKATAIQMKPVDDALKMEQVLTPYAFGNYLNKPVSLTLTVEDQAESPEPSEVKSVILFDKSKEPEEDPEKAPQSKEDQKSRLIIEPAESSGNEYRFVLSEPCDIGELYVRMTDENNTSDTKSVRELLAQMGDEKDFAWKTITSDRWVTDINAPDIGFSVEGSIEDEDSLIFGKDGGKLTATISDVDLPDKDLKTIRISRRFKAFGSEEFGDETTVQEVAFEENTKDKYLEILDTSSADFQTGTYEYTFFAEDFAGNPATAKKVFEVDHSEPGGVIEVVHPEVKQISYDGGVTENWVKEDTDSGAVTFRVYPRTGGSPVRWIEVTINGKTIRYPYTHNAEEPYLEFNVRKDDIPYDNDCYNVTAKIVTKARNSGSAAYTLHLDTQAPTVLRVTAEKKDNALQNAINFLTFGTFFNDSIILSAMANDGSYGVGLDYAQFIYENGTENLQSGKVYFDNAKSSGDKTVSFDMNMLENEEIVYANVKVIVVDKLGKSTEILPKVSDPGGSSSGNNYVMLETVRPTAVLTLPSGEGAARADNQIWYRTDQKITLEVSDNQSGIREVSFTVNGKKVTTDNNGLKLATASDTGGEKITSLSYEFSSEQLAAMDDAGTSGRYHLECVVTDNAGNPSLLEQKDFYRDVNAPEIKHYAFKPFTVDGTEGTDNFVSELRYSFYFKDAAAVVVTVDDTKSNTVASSGNHEMHFRLVSYANGEQVKTDTYVTSVVDNQAECVLPKDFKGQVYAKADDMVGNISDEVTSYAMILDTEAPTVTIEPLPAHAAGKDNNGNALYTEPVSFRVTVTDTQSGLREIIHSQSSELNSYDPVVTSISDNGDASLQNGWEIVGRDENLITEVSRVFSFSADDNDIQLSFSATDRSRNASATVNSTPFTIDTIAPQVAINTNPSALLNGRYYQGSTSFTITVTERNFDSALMIDTITNTYTSAQPSVSFSSTEGNSVHSAVVTFPEGDYDFSFTGQDLGGHVTQIYVDGSADPTTTFHTNFNVDATPPTVSTNFSEFNGENSGNYFKEEKTATITVTEHNFDETDMRLQVESKTPGSDHSDSGWYEIGTSQAWDSNGDTHSISIPCKDDAVYKISINPQDRAENQGQGETSPIFEIDTTVPKLYSRNDVLATEKNFVETPYYEVYDEKKKDDPVPKVEFEDNNFDYIKVEAGIYRPVYKNGMEFDKITADKLSNELTKNFNNKVFSVDSFNQDGVYAFTYTAVDKAGNESKPINDTYFHMVDTDLLAYITNSSISEHTGYYSLMDENGKAISKKATNFSDLSIGIITFNDDKDAGTVVLRNDEDSYATDTHLTETDEVISETAHIATKTLPASYFSDTFKDDSLDTRLYLSVSIDDTSYLDLASIHIDNEPPFATLPEDFVSWHNYMFTDSVTVTLTNVTETLDENATFVYECPREDERVPIAYNYDKANKELSFELKKGLHHIDLVLTDEAGNEWNAERVRYLRVGNLRLYLGAGAVLLAGGAAAAVILLRKRKIAKKK